MPNVKRYRNFVVLGARGTGKTSICQRFTKGKFNPAYEPTYESSFSRTLKYKGEEIECLIKDTQGDEGDSTLRTEYGVGKHGYVIVYSVTSLRSFEAVRQINNKVTELVGTSSVPKIIVGNKADDNCSTRQVSTSQGMSLASELGCLFLECSAKDNWATDQPFELLLHQVERIYNPNTDSNTLVRCCTDACTTVVSVADWCCPATRRDDRLLNSDQPKEPSPTMRKIVFMLLGLTLLYGCAEISGGIVFGVKSKKEGSDLLAYILFGFGLITSLVSILGIFGAFNHSREFLRVSAGALIVIFLVELVVWCLLFGSMPILRDHLVYTLVLAGGGAVLEVATISITCWYQTDLLPEETVVSQTDGYLSLKV